MYDVVVVGSGHNGMIAAAYLAKTGLKICVCERRPIVGGAVCTETDRIPGYRIDVGSSAHVMIHQTPVIRELELERHGLEYIDMDPWAFYPIPGQAGLYFYRSVEKTCQSIARVSQKDAEAYARFVEAWGKLNEGVFEVFLKPPTPWNMVSTMFGRSLKGENRMNMIRHLMGPYGQLVLETFESEPVRTAIIWLAAQSGPPPSEAASGDFAGWHSMYHQSGMKRARGGSGALTQALKNRILADGSEVRENAPVTRILTDGQGRATGVELEGGESLQAKAVLAACHVKTTLETLLKDAPDLPDELRHRSTQLRVGNGFGMIVRCAMSGLPEYPGEPVDAQGVSPAHHGLQLLCPSRAALDAAYGDYLAGRPPEKPIPLSMTFSAIDPTLTPEGKHTLFVWGQYHPYELRNGEQWDHIADREADKLLAAVDEFAPGTSGKVLNRYIQTPLEIERLHGLLRGNVMHLEMSFDQMFCFRPMPELSSYTVPAIQGLFLTGASTHPGGGVWGASGYNAARVVLKHWKALKR
ncbi:MAG: phytoene desaturase family protein [Opitutales bacterium]